MTFNRVLKAARHAVARWQWRRDSGTTPEAEFIPEWMSGPWTLSECCMAETNTYGEREKEEGREIFEVARRILAVLEDSYDGDEAQRD